jgi:sodium/hydrogen exchanger-like protein 6/7
MLYLPISFGVFGFNASYLECVIIGAILSSTDPVTIISLFHQLKVDEKLYAIIFGESILNDSVAIVLFSVLGHLHSNGSSFETILRATVSFFAIFTGSVMIGIIVGLFCAILLKYTDLEEYPSLETSSLVLMGYMSYLISNAMHFSGIVSMLFCAIIMKHYAYDNMSTTSRQTTKNMFRVLSLLSENFIFIYLGLTLFTSSKLIFIPGLIVYSLVAILVARFISVIPLAEAINYFGRISDPQDRNPKIPKNHQLMIWWAGLRGAIAFALSFEVPGPNTIPIQTTILVVCVISVIALGGTTPFAIDYLKIETGQYSDCSSEPDDARVSYDSPARSSFDSDILPTSPPNHWFLNFDKKYLKPVFTTESGARRDSLPTSQESLLLNSRRAGEMYTN